ncbi:MAG: putative peptidyl-prolyl cis-trans isomerase YacD [Fimbriimonadales bacterium]|nr:MAG: putative peptidyl-prolyl cis-trans isomerase YacD [Fimbriimonadales bacterium]GIV11556.1 MAG: putative peptidyl-prolyl cis-trans isomerase YacD [Fimbriimonadales bacterium]
MKLSSLLGVGFATTLTLVTLSACGGGKQDTTVAKVGDSPIDKDMYLRRLELMPTPVQIAGNQATTAPAGYTTLVQMIREQVMLDMAKEEGVLPTDQQVEERVQREMKNNPQIKQAITEQRLTLDDYRQRVRVALAEFNMLTKGVTVTEQEIKKAYEDNKQAFYRPANASVRFIIVGNPEVRKQIDDDLKRGFNFQSVVNKYAQNPVAGVQANQGEIPLEGALPQNPQERQAALRLRSTLKNAKPMEVTAWLPVGTGLVARFEVLAKTEGRQLPYEEVKDQIREALMIQKGRQTNRDLNLEMAKRMANTPVEIKSEAWKKQYEKDIAELKKTVEEAEKQLGKQSSGAASPQNASAQKR